MIGDVGVGKSSLFLKFTENKFVGNEAVTVGADFKVKLLNID